MELSIIKRESTGSGSSLYNESETITKFEIMDGAPVRGIILFLIKVKVYRSDYSSLDLISLRHTEISTSSFQQDII
jgi:hypothetical protein